MEAIDSSTSIFLDKPSPSDINVVDPSEEVLSPVRTLVGVSLVVVGVGWIGSLFGCSVADWIFKFRPQNLDGHVQLLRHQECR